LNAKVGDDLKGIATLNADTLKHKTGGQEADQGRQADLAGCKPQKKGYGYPDWVHLKSITFLNVFYS
jgi:hypothetical protein